MACVCDITCLCEKICGGKGRFDTEDFKLAILQLLCGINTGGIIVTPAASPVTAEAAVATVTTGGTGVTVLAANPDRKPGSYIQNISDTDMEYDYDGSVATGSAGILSAGGTLLLSLGDYVNTDAITLRQASGSDKKVWVVEMLAA